MGRNSTFKWTASHLLNAANGLGGRNNGPRLCNYQMKSSLLITALVNLIGENEKSIVIEMMTRVRKRDCRWIIGELSNIGVDIFQSVGGCLMIGQDTLATSTKARDRRFLVGIQLIMNFLI